MVSSVERAAVFGNTSRPHQHSVGQYFISFVDGGAVVAACRLGEKKKEPHRRRQDQLLLCVTGLRHNHICCGGNRFLLLPPFSESVDEEVMNAAIYLYPIALSFPLWGIIYNASAAL